MAPACDPRNKGKAEGLWAEGQPGLHSETLYLSGDGTMVVTLSLTLPKNSRTPWLQAFFCCSLGVCTCMWVCVCTHMCRHVEARGQHLLSSLSHHLVPWRQSFAEAGAHWFGLAVWLMSARDLFISSPPLTHTPTAGWCCRFSAAPHFPVAAGEPSTGPPPSALTG